MEDATRELFCPNCRGGNPVDATKCLWCGSSLAEAAGSQAVPLPERSTPPATASGGSTDAPPAPQPTEAEPDDVANIRNKVSQVLSKGEKIEYIAVESKPVQINIAPDAVVLTNRRLIIYRPRFLGQVQFEDYLWRNLRDARISEGVLRARFAIDVIPDQDVITENDQNTPKTIEVHDLIKEQARRVYQFAQEMEEYVKEERRQRKMEEERAAAGGVYMHTPGAPSIPGVSVPSSPGDDPVEKLRQLKEMLDAGLITSTIYEAKRNEILSKM